MYILYKCHGKIVYVVGKLTYVVIIKLEMLLMRIITPVISHVVIILKVI